MFGLSCFSALEYTDGRSFMEDLNEAPETVEELFNGRPLLNFDQSGRCCLFRLIFRFSKALQHPAEF